MTGGSSLPRPVRRLIAAMTATAVGCLLAGAAALVLGWPGAQKGWQPGSAAEWVGWWRPVAAAAGIAVLSQVRCSVRFGGQRYMLAMGEAGMVLAFGLVPPLWVLLLTAPAVAIATGLPPRRQAPVKALYNTAVAVVGTAAAIAGVTAVGASPTQLDSLVDLLGLGLAAVLFTGVCEVATSAVVAASSGRRTLEVLRHDPVLKLVSLSGNLALAAVVWMLAAVDPRLLLVPAALVVTLNSAYTGWIRVQAERRRRHELAAAVAQLAVDGPGQPPIDPGADAADGADTAADTAADARAAVLQRAAIVTADLFSADVVELELHGTAEQPEPSLGPPSLLHRHHVHAPELDYTGPAELAPASLTTPAAAAPLRGEDGSTSGELRIAFAAAAGPVRLDEREAGDLAAVAAAVPAAVAAAVRQARELQLRAAAEHQATHDPLTGLPNQRLLLHRALEGLSDAASAISSSRGAASDSAGGVPAAVPALAVIEVPGLPQLNRTLGHVAGDRLLTAVAGRLSAAAGPNDVLARLDGGRFAVLTSVPAAPAGSDRRDLSVPRPAPPAGPALEAGREPPRIRTSTTTRIRRPDPGTGWRSACSRHSASRWSCGPGRSRSRPPSVSPKHPGSATPASGCGRPRSRWPSRPATGSGSPATTRPSTSTAPPACCWPPRCVARSPNGGCSCASMSRPTWSPASPPRCRRFPPGRTPRPDPSTARTCSAATPSTRAAPTS
jgi:GGDEF domain-containing protein